MSLLEKHISYLVRRHDCVVVPGLGAFLCKYNSAQFDQNGVTILPPGRKLAFNRWLCEDDGLLQYSVAKANHISVSDATDLIRKCVDDIHSRLAVEESVKFGNLGTFHAYKATRDIDFIPYPDMSGINGSMFGLLPITPLPISDVKTNRETQKHAVCPDSIERGNNGDDTAKRLSWYPQQWRAYASGIIASLALFFTLIFFIVSPIRVETNTQSASIAPMSSASQETEIDQEIIVSDDSISYSTISSDEHQLENINESSKMDDPDEVMFSDRITDSEDGLEINDPSADTQRDSSSASVTRFNAEDPYIVVVASFPTMSQAESYMNENGRMKLGVVHMNGRYRVYAATGNNYSTAARMKELVSQHDAWICQK